MRLGSRFQRLLRRYDAAVNAEGKEPVAARSAAIRGGAKQAIQPAEHAHPVLARNAGQVHVAALFAMYVPHISDGGSPGEKARFAGPATPGTQTGHPGKVVLKASPAGAAGTVAMTDRTQQILFSPGTLKKGYVKADSCGKFHLRGEVAPCTIMKEVQDGRLHRGTRARGD